VAPVKINEQKLQLKYSWQAIEKELSCSNLIVELDRK